MYLNFTKTSNQKPKTILVWYCGIDGYEQAPRGQKQRGEKQKKQR